MEKEFAKVMSERTDKELIKITTIEKDGYNPTAIIAAELEIKKRNINVNDFEKIKEKAIFEKQQIEKIDSTIVSSGIRFINFIIDSIIYLIIIALLTFPLKETHILLGYLIMFLTFIGYYSIMEIKFQKTIGKFITKTKVVNINGDKPGNTDIVSRTFFRLIPFDRISFLFTKNGFHDFLSKTKVIYNTKD